MTYCLPPPPPPPPPIRHRGDELEWAIKNPIVGIVHIGGIGTSIQECVLQKNL